MLYRVQSKKNVSEAASALEAAGQKYKFGVVAVHDVRGIMKGKGVDFERDILIYEVCNPQQAKTVLEANAEIATVLPCRISIYPEGETTTLAMLRPTALLDLFHTPGLRRVAEDVEEVMKKMMNEAAS